MLQRRSAHMGFISIGVDYFQILSIFASARNCLGLNRMAFVFRGWGGHLDTLEVGCPSAGGEGGVGRVGGEGREGEGARAGRG